VPALMKAADWVLCKAGGLVVTEALACGRPMMLVDVLPGQETGNADYVVENGAGDLTMSMAEVLASTAHWLMNDRQMLKVRTENAKRMGRPNAAYEVANEAWVSAQRRVIRTRPGTGRLRLIDLLSRNQINLDDDSNE
jgi:1,2-diacylglycerol 3-beta-galactosyltransferase